MLTLSRAKNAHVLVVDDDVLTRTTLRALLEHMGCSCEAVDTGVAASAAVASAALAGRPVELVLLDAHLVGERGEDVCRRLRGEGVEVPIVSISGDGSDAPMGFDGRLRKPFSAEELHACVESQVGRSRGERHETS